MHPGSLDGTGRGQEMPGSQHLSLLPSRWTWILVWFLTALYASYCAKQLKQRQINKLADAGGGSIFSVWVFFPDYLKKLCPIWVFGLRRNRSLSVEFWMPLRWNLTEWFFPRSWRLVCSETTLWLMLWYKILQHFLTSLRLLFLCCRCKGLLI